MRPELVLCDEPTGNLDAKTGDQIIALFKELHAHEGLTLLVVTHDDALARAAGRVVSLEGGRLEPSP